MTMIVPPDRKERNPLITEAGYRNLLRIAESAHAPKWNYVVGDRVVKDDLVAVDRLRENLETRRFPFAAKPPEPILEWVVAMREKVTAFRERIGDGMDLVRDWTQIPTMSREDLAARMVDVLPVDADLSRLIVYDTSGTTGHAINIPYHPRTMAQNHAFLELALARHGVQPVFADDTTACFNVGGHQKTVVFPVVFSVWNQAGFAKINFHPADWSSPDAAQKFFDELQPLFVTGEPLGFAEMLRWGICTNPAAIVSTAVTLDPALAMRLRETYHCPVIDWFSLTETGPLAYSCTEGHGMHVMPHDVFIEIVDELGNLVEPGEVGEIVVTGGRNPYVPLLRYRTGDFAALDFSPCPCGDPMPRIVGFTGRGIVLFRSADGSVVNPVDIGREMRRFPFLQHTFLQRRDGSCEVRLRPAPNIAPNLDGIGKVIADLFGDSTPVELIVDPALHEKIERGKRFPYESELTIDD